MGRAPEPAAINACDMLPLTAYSPMFNQELGREVLAAAASDLWPEFVRDAVALRDAVRACRSTYRKDMNP